jgi:hypothetical protein
MEATWGQAAASTSHGCRSCGGFQPAEGVSVGEWAETGQLGLRVVGH